MEKPSPTATDPVDMLRRMSADHIARRLAEIDAEAKSLRVILRSLRARETAARRRKAVPQ